MKNTYKKKTVKEDLRQASALINALSENHREIFYNDLSELINNYISDNMVIGSIGLTDLNDQVVNFISTFTDTEPTHFTDSVLELANQTYDEWIDEEQQETEILDGH